MAPNAPCLGDSPAPGAGRFWVGAVSPSTGSPRQARDRRDPELRRRAAAIENVGAGRVSSARSHSRAMNAAGVRGRDQGSAASLAPCSLCLTRRQSWVVQPGAERRAELGRPPCERRKVEAPDALCTLVPNAFGSRPPCLERRLVTWWEEGPEDVCRGDRGCPEMVNS